MNQKFIKLVISFLLVGSYFFLPKYGFTAFNYTPFATFVLAVLCSFLPCPLLPLYGESAAFTMGFSGVLFAMVGISWGKVGRFREMLRRNKWYLIIPAFLPHVNFLIHIYCLLAGYLYGMLCAKKSKLS